VKTSPAFVGRGETSDSEVVEKFIALKVDAAKPFRGMLAIP